MWGRPLRKEEQQGRDSPGGQMTTGGGEGRGHPGWGARLWPRTGEWCGHPQTGTPGEEKEEGSRALEWKTAGGKLEKPCLFRYREPGRSWEDP